MSRKKDNLKTLEQCIAAISISSKSKASLSRGNRKILAGLKNFIRNRNSFDAIITKHIFNTLKRSDIGQGQIVEILLETGCPLDFVLLMENTDVTREILQTKKTILKQTSYLLIELAMRSSFLENIKVLVRYGPGAAERSEIFSTKMFDKINRPKANLNSAKEYVKKLMAADVIDVYTLKFLEETFEVGRANAIRMLLDCKVDVYVKEKLGENLLVHLFGNQQVDVVEFLRGKQFEVNAKCGGMGALHFANLAELDKHVGILLNSGADPNIRDSNGMTPLFAFGNRKCIELLLRNGADVQSIADNGYTILDMLFDSNLLAVMLAHIALIEAQGVTIKTEIRNKIVSNDTFNKFYEKCCKQIEYIGKLNIRGESTLLNILIRKPMYIAHFVNDHDIVNELIKECRNLEIDSYYLTMMERNINKAFSIFLLKSKVVKVLLSTFKEFQLNEYIVGKIVDYLSIG